MMRIAALLQLFAQLVSYLATAGDVCPTEDATCETLAAINPSGFHELSDAGTQFFQISKHATHGNKGAMTLQSSAKASQTPLTNIEPLDCKATFEPLQMIKTETGFALKALNLETGHYTTRKEFPWDVTNPPYADLNACDVNPYDDIIYCVMRADGTSYVVRMDFKNVEFVAILPNAIWSSGAFAHTGEFFVSMHGSELVIVPPLHELPSFSDMKHWKVKNYRSINPGIPKDFWHNADAVVVNRNYTGGVGNEYYISLYGPKLQIAAVEEGKVVQTWIKHIEPARWDNIFGAGWNFDGAVFFSANNGNGVWQIPLDDLDLNEPDQIVQLVQVGLSDATDFNDGLDCHNIPNPWAGEQPAEEVPVTDAPSEAPEATLAPTEAPVEATAPPVTFAPTQPPLAAAPPVTTLAPPTPPPPSWGPVGVFVLLLIPLTLCCLRVLQQNRQESYPPPFMLPAKRNPPPAPVPPIVPIPVAAPRAPVAQPPVVMAPTKPPKRPPAPAPAAKVIIAPPAPPPTPPVAPTPVTIQARPVQMPPRVTEIDIVQTLPGKPANYAGSAKVIGTTAGPVVTEIDRVATSGQVVERDFIIGGAPPVVSGPAVTEIDKVTAAGQVVERDIIVGAAPQVVSSPAVTEIDRVNASGQVVERDFIVGSR